MTTTPKAKKFRMRRREAGQALTAAKAARARNAGKKTPPTADEMPFAQTDDGFGDQTFVKARQTAANAEPEAHRPTPAEILAAQRAGKKPAKPDPDPKARSKPDTSRKPGKAKPASKQSDLEAIRAEGLSARQLRMARRIAQKQGLEPDNDLDAVRQLRERGIDPFKRENILKLVDTKSEAPGPSLLPQTIPQPQVPSTEVQNEADIAREVQDIQRQIVARRRKRSLLLVARLAFFVFLPTLLAGLYFFRIATPMYATHSEFVIQQADAASAASGMAGMFSGTMLATTQDAVNVQSFLQSRDAMLRLDRDLEFKSHFSNPTIDQLQRLSEDPTNEEAFRLYKRKVKIGFDPTEGIVKMEVVAADPQTSQAFSSALISYAEEQVDNLTQRLREDQMSGARESYEEAENKVVQAQQRVLELQEQRGVLSAELEVSSRMNQISALEVELNSERLRLQELQQNARPNSTRVEVAEGNIERLENLIAEMRSDMTEGTGGDISLARISGELVIAEADLQTRQLMLSQSLQQLEMARIEANRQVRYLSLSVTPIAPDEATYPRALENTFLALMVFSGIYLMVSLTASILREQISG